MQLHTLTIDRVFDLQRLEATRHRPRSTLFSFEAAGRARYSVSLPGWPRVAAGDTVQAVLTRAANWQTLAGWKNLSTGETVVPSAGSIWQSIHIVWVTALLYLLTGSATTAAGRPLMFGLRIAFGLALLAVLGGEWRAYRCRQLIRSL